MKVKIESEVAQSCPTPSDPMDCSLPGSSVHGIFQARVLERDAMVVILSEVSQTKKDKYLMILLICDFFKKGTNELNHKTELQMWKTNTISRG